VIDDCEGKLSSRDAPTREQELEDFGRGRQEVRVCIWVLTKWSIHKKKVHESGM